MPLFRSPPAPASEDAPEHYDLSTPEEVRTRKRRRLLVLGLLALLGLLVAGWFGGRPAVRAVRGWQARRAAAQAEILIDAESWREAQAKVQDGCQLRGTEPDVMRAAGRFLTRVGHPAEALEFWKQLELIRPLAPDEQRDYGSVEMALGDLDAADTRLRKAWPAGTDGTPEDWRQAMELAQRRHTLPDALALARKLAESPAATEGQRLAGVVLLLSQGTPEDHAKDWPIVQKMAEGKTPEALEALVLLSRQVGGALAAAAAPGGAAQHVTPIAAPADLAARLEAHPLARIQHRLLALDLLLAADPSRRAALIQTAIERFRTGEPEDLAGLGAWLYSKGEFTKALEIIPENKAVLNRALYLQYLDLLGALNRWHDIEDLIQRQRFTLDPMTEQMYLARCSDEQKQTAARDVHWNAAVAAAGASVTKLLAVGSYAARTGAIGPAEAAFRAAIKAEPASRPAYNALLDLLQHESRTADIYQTLQAMAAHWPEDAAVRNDVAYTSLLLDQDPAAARDTARDLVRRAPGSLPHRVTLALAELRLGHALTALDAFGGLDVTKVASLPRQLAVYAAVLWATSNEPQARRVAALVPADRLLPQERAMLAEITP